ncbi:MAG: hypothetical protein U1B83_02585 [Candidatus Cloacimonadaceae bacterium]|nr:hypothetical protein [Candidatus Cloacimonadaceae bacterium]
MEKKLLFLLMLAVFAGMGFAQVAGYEFSYSAGIYQEISGGTVLGTAAVGGGANTSLDSNMYPATPIPFPFHYNGLPYTETTVACDGWILLGGTNSVAYTPISNTAVNDGVISALGRDIIGITEAGSLGEIRYQTLGDAPNRVFVVQWKNFRSYYTSAENYNFQIRLHENSTITFLYGPMTVNPPYNPTCQVGLRGAFNTDYNNRTTTTNWAASTRGTANTATMAFNATCYPASGTTFTYTLTVSSAPNPAVLTYPSNNGWAYTDGTLRWQNSGGYPSNYDVYFGTTDSPPFVANVTTTSYTPALAANTTYYWKVVARNSFGNAAATVQSFKTPTPAQMTQSFESAAFPPVGWANPNAWSRSTTTPFHLTAVAYKSANTTPAILATPKLTITPSSTLDFYYRTNSTNGFGRMQIVYSTDRVTWLPIGSVINMPTTTTWNYQSTALGSLSGNYFLGFQVFTISSTSAIYLDHVFGPEYVAEAPAPVVLSEPFDLAVDINPRPLFSWTDPTLGGMPSGYRIYCDTNPDPVTLIGQTTDLTFLPDATLSFGQTYYWKVVAHNSTGDSAPNSVFSFTVWADPTVTAFPWSESFDGTIFAPVGWTNVKTAGTTNPGIWNRATTGTTPTCSPHSGAGMARFNAYGIQTGGRAELTTPPLAMVAGNGYKLKFWMYRDSGYATKPLEVVNVYVNTEPSATGGTLLGTISRYYGFVPVEAVPNMWYEYSFTFDGSVVDKYIVFEGVSEYGNNIFIDDVSVQPINPPAPPSLTYPANLASGLPQAGFDFSWAPDLVNGDAPTYYILYIATSEETIFDEYLYDNITSTSFNPASTIIDPISFDYGTQYYWTVQALNSSGDALATSINRFTIELAGMQAPIVSIINTASGNIELSWAAVTNANSYLVYATDDVYAAVPSWTMIATTASLSHTYAGTETYKFFKVIASTNMP